jgi:hypothetical protein
MRSMHWVYRFLSFFLDSKFCHSACEIFHLSFAKYESCLRGFVLPGDKKTGSALSVTPCPLVIASARLESDKLDPESGD